MITIGKFAALSVIVAIPWLGNALEALGAVTVEEAKRLSQLTVADMKPFWSKGDYNAQTVSGHYFRQAYNLQLKNKTREAIALYKKAIEADTTCMAGYWNLGLCYENLKMWKEAEALYKESTSIYPVSHNFWQHLASVEFRLGKEKDGTWAINRMLDR